MNIENLIDENSQLKKALGKSKLLIERNLMDYKNL
jgi:hypothetical protein